MTGYCPDEALFARLATNELSNTERAELLAHIEECERCRRTAASMVASVSTTSLGDTAPSLLPRSLEPGVILGPYHLVKLLGAGSMGTVFAAWDPRLERQVALKVLHSDSASLREEARLMAKLTHPNIVTVHEVAEWQGRLVLVMELVNGGTLREWLATRPALPAIVEVFTQLAEALAAAHDAGVVHRDFKPDNVLIDVKGRARLSDFGLGTLATANSAASQLVGTPAYLAPAQLDGRPGDASADQFALSVSLWEAITGERPFRASTLAQLRAAQQLEPTKPAGRPFPRWLERVVRRGLSPDPSVRFPTMSAFAKALAAGPPRWPWVLAACTVVLTLAPVVYVGVTQDPCRDVGADLDAHVSTERRTAREAAFDTTHATFATLAATETNRLLAEYVNHWKRLSLDTCRAEKRDRSISAARGAALRECLDLRRREVESLVTSLSAPAPEMVAEAPAAVLGLRDLESCQRLDLSETNSAERAVRLEIASLRHLVAIGRPAEVRAGIERLRPQVQSLDAGVAQAELGWLDTQAAIRHYESNATARARDCARRALEVREDGIAAECLASVAITMSLRERQPLAARAALDLAQALSVREPPSLRADVNLTIASIHVARVEGNHERSLQIATDAVARLTKTAGAEHHHVLTIRSYVPMKHALLGHFAEAYAENAALLEVMTRTMGDEHPATLVVRNNQSLLARKVGKLEEARALAEAVLRVRSRTLGAKNYGTMAAQLNLGAAERQLGRLDLAETLLTEVLESVQRERGPEHFDLVEPLEELALVRAARGSKDEARAMLTRALGLRRSNADSAFRIAATEDLLRAVEHDP